MADRKVFDVRFDFSMSKSPRGQVLSRFGWIGDGFIRVNFSKKVFFTSVHGVDRKLIGLLGLLQGFKEVNGCYSFRGRFSSFRGLGGGFEGF